MAAGPARPARPASPADPPPLECPFCPLLLPSTDSYTLLLHIESQHTENSPFIPSPGSDTSSLAADYDPDDNDPEKRYVICPEEGCEEPILLIELQTHMDFHSAESIAMEEERDKPPRLPERPGREGRGRREEERGYTYSYSSGAPPPLPPRGREERPRRDGRDGRDRKERDGKGEKEKEKSGLSLWQRAALALVRGGDQWLQEQQEKLERLELDKVRRRHSTREGVRREEDRRGRYSEDHHRDRYRERRRSEERHRDRREDGHRERRHRSRHHSKHRDPDRERRRKERTSDASGHRKKRRKPRLGTADLGPYAHERRMPRWLRDELLRGPQTSYIRTINPLTGHLETTLSVANETPNLIPVLASLLALSPSIASATLCHPGVKHIGKQHPKEGGFCGYRNIQMMISYIQSALPEGTHPFDGRIPGVLALQDMIEQGWDLGINSIAREETGGVKGTRKYIGTSEAQTLFTVAGLTPTARYFGREAGDGTQASLLRFVENYYGVMTDDEDDEDEGAKVRITDKPPMYFQHAGHSMTVVGYERRLDGEVGLIVFDPFWGVNERMRGWAEGGGRVPRGVETERLLRMYRRGREYLGKYEEFEIIVLGDEV